MFKTYLNVSKSSFINPIWLCEETGGTSKITELKDIYPFVTFGFCECPGNEVYIDEYGCADCNSFDHKETIEYCTTQKNNDFRSYFKKICN